jgi:hypothetical protein
MMQILNRSHAALTLLRASRHRAPVPRWAGIAAASAGALAAGLAGFAAALVLLPPALVFPVTAMGLLVAAATLAIVAWASPPETGAARLVFFDTAGALTLIGLAALLFGEPEQAVALLDRDR